MKLRQPQYRKLRFGMVIGLVASGFAAEHLHFGIGSTAGWLVAGGIGGAVVALGLSRLFGNEDA